jgi:CAAX prenyl protease-like protein
MTILERFPSIPYVAPFATFMALLLVGPVLPLSYRAEALLRFGLVLAVLLVCSWRVVSFRIRHWATSAAVGIGIFALWIAPDVFFPDLRGSWLFTNGFTGKVEGSFPEAARGDWLVLSLRFARAALLVPVVEELFWRAWLPRYIDRTDDFRSVPLGQFSRAAFLLTALLFASEHGAMWDVGLVAGLVYNYWMQRTRSLGDLILAHAVTNACLSVYVVTRGRWEYW